MTKEVLSALWAKIKSTFVAQATFNEYKNTITTELGKKADASTLADYYTSSEVDGLLDDKADASSVYTKGQVDTELGKKQDKLTAGTGIEISNGTIKTTLDTTVFIFADSLPSSDIKDDKIYVVPTEGGGATQNAYTEWFRKNNAWEKLGEFKADIDLTQYYTKTEVDAKITAMKLTEVGGAGKFVQKVAQANGVVTATAVDLNAAAVANGSKVTGTTVKDALEALQTQIQGVSAEAITVEGGDGIAVSKSGTTNTVKVDLADADKYLEITSGGKLASKGIDTAISTAKTGAVTEAVAEVEKKNYATESFVSTAIANQHKNDATLEDVAALS